MLGLQVPLTRKKGATGTREGEARGKLLTYKQGNTQLLEQLKALYSYTLEGW
jgi:hypothetical protein